MNDSSAWGVNVTDAGGRGRPKSMGWPGVDPGAPAAVEHLDVAVAVVVEHPPDAGGGEALGVVVGDHGGVVADAQAFGVSLELLRRHHVLPVVGILGPVVGKVSGAGDVPALPGVGGVGAVQDHHVGIVEMRGEPGGVGKVFGMGVAVSGGGHREAPA